ncbi:hypothetical protein Y032_0041g364 [Ancylostoma ceylanicum]|uniref:Uncharacterized protein n=1 Tax=Ancylostoma ceylanicum TaxID=53326 RepID=A0A016UGV2_9BILA|nr:hypothetical protein Y032_0041g364 [Ancylostoma ceylanicum]
MRILSRIHKLKLVVVIPTISHASTRKASFATDDALKKRNVLEKASRHRFLDSYTIPSERTESKGTPCIRTAGRRNFTLPDLLV